jgi:hypothetical protein
MVEFKVPTNDGKGLLETTLQTQLFRKGRSPSLSTSQGEVKMSEILGEFVEPYADSAKNYAQSQKLYELATLAWNLALMPEAEQEKMINEFLDQGLKERYWLVQGEVQAVLEEMITRKQTFFADCRRYIIDFKLQDAGDQLHLSVASTLDDRFSNAISPTLTI